MDRNISHIMRCKLIASSGDDIGVALGREGLAGFDILTGENNGSACRLGILIISDEGHIEALFQYGKEIRFRERSR